MPPPGDAQPIACSEKTEMPAVQRVFGPVPLPGQWRGRGFGDKRKLDVEIAQCGRIIEDMVGVRLKHVAPISVDLERDEDDGRYKASYTHAERGMAVVVRWDLEAESEARVVGRMSIMGRSDEVEFELLEPEPSVEMTACGCAAVQERRDLLVAALNSATSEVQNRSGAAAGALSSWTVEPSTCTLRENDVDQTLPTRASFDAVLRADWRGQLVHQRSCCRRHSEGSAFTEADYASGREEALSVAIAALDEWLEDGCPQEEP